MNRLGGKRAPFPKNLGSFAVLFPLRHDAWLDCPPQECRQLRKLVFALLDQLFAKPHQRILKTVQRSTHFLRFFLYFNQSYSTGKLTFAAEKYLRASTQSSPTCEKPIPASGSCKPGSSKILTEERSLSLK